MFIKTEKGAYVNTNQITSFNIVQETKDVSKHVWDVKEESTFTVKGYSAHNGTFFFGTHNTLAMAETHLESIIERINTQVYNVDAHTHEGGPDVYANHR